MVNYVSPPPDAIDALDAITVNDTLIAIIALLALLLTIHNSTSKTGPSFRKKIGTSAIPPENPMLAKTCFFQIGK
jgi:hypothetical protein